MALNWFDYVILAFMLLSMYICYRRGFVGSTITLLCWILALVGALKLAHAFGNIFEGSVQNEHVRDILGFFIIFIILALIGVLIVYICNHLIEKASLERADKIVGGISGIIVGAFVISGLLLLAEHSVMPKQNFWKQSSLIPYFHSFEDIINDVLPSSAQIKRTVLSDKIDEASDNIAQGIEQAKEKTQETAQDVQDNMQETAQNVQDKVQDKMEDVQEKGKELGESTKDFAKSATD